MWAVSERCRRDHPGGRCRTGLRTTSGSVRSSGIDNQRRWRCRFRPGSGQSSSPVGSWSRAWLFAVQALSAGCVPISGNRSTFFFSRTHMGLSGSDGAIYASRSRRSSRRSSAVSTIRAGWQKPLDCHAPDCRSSLAQAPLQGADPHRHQARAQPCRSGLPRSRGRRLKDVCLRPKGWVTRAIKRELKRRSAIEPAIGHMKNGGHLGRCYLKGRIGDAMNVVLVACGHNLRKSWPG